MSSLYSLVAMAAADFDELPQAKQDGLRHARSAYDWFSFASNKRCVFSYGSRDAWARSEEVEREAVADPRCNYLDEYDAFLPAGDARFFWFVEGGDTTLERGSCVLHGDRRVKDFAVDCREWDGR